MICKKGEKDISGQRFGMLTAIKRDFSKNGREVFWIFQCDCGEVKSINKKRFTQQKTKSCGCLQKDAARISISRFNNRQGFEAHLSSKDPLYDIWKAIKQRCLNPNNQDYARYGGRGITICDRWAKSFTNFINDMGQRPMGATIDRIDNNKGYSPDNCRWATMKEQCTNRSSNRNVTINGVTYRTISDAERATGLTRMQIRHGLKNKTYY